MSSLKRNFECANRAKLGAIIDVIIIIVIIVVVDIVVVIVIIIR